MGVPLGSYEPATVGVPCEEPATMGVPSRRAPCDEPTTVGVPCGCAVGVPCEASLAKPPLTVGVPCEAYGGCPLRASGGCPLRALRQPPMRRRDPPVVVFDVDPGHGAVLRWRCRRGCGSSVRRTHTACSVIVRALGQTQALAQYRRHLFPPPADCRSRWPRWCRRTVRSRVEGPRPRFVPLLRHDEAVSTLERG